MEDPDRHLQFVFKSSPYGSLSHSHGDQNAFVLYAHGEDLAIQSGYYVAFNSQMHLNWRRQTRSKNAVLIGGKGQYAEKDKALARRAAGRIVSVEEQPGHVRIVGDATAAYQVANPLVQKVLRETHFVNDSYFVIVDEVECSEPQELQWLCHTLGAPQTGRSSFRYNGRKAGFYGQFVYFGRHAANQRRGGFSRYRPERIRRARHTPPCLRHGSGRHPASPCHPSGALQPEGAEAHFQLHR